MPMQLTVTRNRKRSENYNSEGYGISLTVELDQGLLARPSDLQGRIAALYSEAELALGQQARSSTGGPPEPPTDKEDRRRHGRSGGNGHGRGRHQRDTGATRAQLRAIHAIGKQLGIDVEAECGEQFGVGLEGLTVRKASAFIDSLKEMQSREPAHSGDGGER